MEKAQIFRCARLEDRQPTSDADERLLEHILGEVGVAGVAPQVAQQGWRELLDDLPHCW